MLVICIGKWYCSGQKKGQGAFIQLIANYSSGSGWLRNETGQKCQIFLTQDSLRHVCPHARHPRRQLQRQLDRQPEWHYRHLQRQPRRQQHQHAWWAQVWLPLPQAWWRLFHWVVIDLMSQLVLPVHRPRKVT